MADPIPYEAGISVNGAIDTNVGFQIGGAATLGKSLVGDGTNFVIGDAYIRVRKNSTGSTFARPRINLIEGTNITLTVSDDSTDGEVDITVSSSAGGGSVTSVALSLPSIFSVSGSPITTSGTLAVTLVNQNANLVFAGPASGGAAAPTFRSLVAADMPAFTGDVTTSAGSTATTIANDAVTYAKMQNVSAASRLLGRGSASGSGDVQELTAGTGLAISGTALTVTGLTPGSIADGISVSSYNSSAVSLRSTGDKLTFAIPSGKLFIFKRLWFLAQTVTSATGGPADFTVKSDSGAITYLSGQVGGIDMVSGAIACWEGSPADGSFSNKFSTGNTNVIVNVSAAYSGGTVDGFFVCEYLIVNAN